MAVEVLTVRDVVAGYPGHPDLFSPQTFSLSAGHALHVAGPNGVGKSTFLRVAAGLMKPRAGTVQRHGGVGLSTVAWKPPATSVRDFVSLMAACHGHVKELSAAAWDRLEYLDFDGQPGSRLTNLSTGNRQKLSLTVALMGNPDVLIVDEPWAGLDTHSCSLATTMLTQRLAAGAAVLVTDHGTHWQDLPGCTSIRLGSRSGSCDAVTLNHRPAVVHIVVSGRSGEPALTCSMMSNESHALGWQLTVTAADSDAAVIELLTAGWHLEHLGPPD